jgi:hypothetical protein
MDPLSVLKTLRRHKWVALPVVLLTVYACIYVMFFAQRTYQATMTYALITPKVPSALELQTSPQLAKVNGDNPYLRSSDSTLLSQVLLTKLGGQETADVLRKKGLGTEYTVAQASNQGSGMLLQLSASGMSPQQAVDTVQALAKQLTTTLQELQKVNGADDAYLFSALPVDGPGNAQEIFSSRLRTLIIVAVGGAFLVFGAVSVARSLELARERRAEAQEEGQRARHLDSERKKTIDRPSGQKSEPPHQDDGPDEATSEMSDDPSSSSALQPRMMSATATD